METSITRSRVATQCTAPRRMRDSHSHPGVAPRQSIRARPRDHVPYNRRSVLNIYHREIYSFSVLLSRFRFHFIRETCCVRIMLIRGLTSWNVPSKISVPVQEFNFDCILYNLLKQVQYLKRDFSFHMNVIKIDKDFRFSADKPKDL